MYYCTCGWRIFSEIEIKCPKCGAIGEVSSGDKPRPASAWLRWVKLLRKPQDKGVGDTIERMIASVGLDRWKTFSKKMGMPCNCDNRRDWLNENYPY